MRSVFDSGGTTAGSLRSRSRAIGARSECTRHRSRPSATYGKERRSALSLDRSSWRSAPSFTLVFSRSLSSPSVRSTGSNETPAQRLLRIAFGYWPVPSNTERLEIHAPSLIARQGSGLQRAELSICFAVVGFVKTHAVGNDSSGVATARMGDVQSPRTV